MTIEELKAEFRIDLASDPWGHCMGCRFDLCAELWHRGDPIPDDWHYGPGATNDPREPDSYWFSVLQDVDSAVLVEFGTILKRYSDKLEAAGHSY